MTNQKVSKPKLNKKLQQFTEELGALCKKYQYELKPQLAFTVDGIRPMLNVSDKIPPIGKGKKLNVDKKKKQG